MGNYLLGNKPKISLQNKKFRLIKIFDLSKFKLHRYILVDFLQLSDDPFTSVSLRKSPFLNWIIEHTEIGIDTRFQKFK